MGRASTGAVTTGEVTRLELSYLLRARLSEEGMESCIYLRLGTGQMEAVSDIFATIDDDDEIHQG